MAEQLNFKFPAHHNIYTGSSSRELRVEFSIPQNGVNFDTGLAILVPGFGGNIDSRIYKKMRDIFADKYNMVTIQCDYFGSKFMQGVDEISIKENEALRAIFTEEEIHAIKKDIAMLSHLLAGKNVVLKVEVEIHESLEEFNDMSYMQAIDIITAIEAVKFALNDNGLAFNSNRVIGYGHSQGAYLLHLANVLAPNLFSYIIDNSAWVEPAYLSDCRNMVYQVDKSIVAFEFNYLARQIVNNKKDLNLNELYKNYSGNTQILSFQGDNDNLINHNEKKHLIEKLNNSRFILVTEKDVDNIKYKSNTHGLDADFIALFSYALNYELPKKGNNELNWKYALSFDGVEIEVDYPYSLPVFNFNFR